MFENLNIKKHIPVQLLVVALAFPYAITKANDSLFENNIEIINNQLKTQSANYEKSIIKSLFLPELSINTGLSSEFTKDRAVTDRGPYLFLSGKINLYHGGQDLNKATKNDTLIAKLNFDNEKTKRKIQIDSFKLLAELNLLNNDNSLIAEEIKNNELQLKMAKKKVDAGLTTSADLLDFQIKNENLMNELSSNQYKINDIEKELVAMFGNKIGLNQIKNEIQTLPNPELDKIDVHTLPEVQALHQDLLNTKLEISNIHSEYLPTIDLEGKYGNITPTQKLFDNKTEHQIALNLTIPLFTGFTTSSKLSQTILNSTRAEHELRQLEINLEKRIDLDKRKINLNGKILSNLEKSLEKASKYKELILFEYKKGIKNSSDVINASDKQFELNRKINELKNENSQLIFTYNTNFKKN